MLFRVVRNPRVEESGCMPCSEWAEVLAIEPRAITNEDSGHDDWRFKGLSNWYVCNTDSGLTRIPDSDFWHEVDGDEFVIDDHRHDNHEGEAFESNLAGYLLVCYLADCTDQLDPDKALKLTHLSEQLATEHWKAAVANDITISDEQVVEIYESCKELFGPKGAIQFIAKGLGCIDAEVRVDEVLG